VDLLDIKRPSKDSATQTVLVSEHSPDDNSDAFFDISEGWVLPVSTSVIARLRWRRAMNFAKCHFCRGVSEYVLYYTTAIYYILSIHNSFVVFVL